MRPNWTINALAELVCLALVAGLAGAQTTQPAGTTAVTESQAAPLSALARMPVKEVTVFKDGHAFVLHEGKMPTDADGRRADGLPARAGAGDVLAVLDRQGRQAGGRDGRRSGRCSVERTALSLAS